MSGPRVALPDLTPRLQAAGQRVAELREQLQHAIKARSELVVDAVDEGMTQKAVARAVGLSQPHINRILTDSQPDAVLPR